MSHNLVVLSGLLILSIGVYSRVPSKASEIVYVFELKNDLPYDQELGWIDYEGFIGSQETLHVNKTLRKESFFNHRWVITSENGDYKEIHLGTDEFRKSGTVINVSEIFDIENPSTTTIEMLTKLPDIKVKPTDEIPLNASENTFHQERESLPESLDTKMTPIYTTTTASSTTTNQLMPTTIRTSTQNFQMNTTSSIRNEIIWNEKDSSLYCDFIGNDLENRQIIFVMCRSTCEFQVGCTHYSYKNNTCYLKKGPVSKLQAVFNPVEDSRCGIIASGVDWHDKNWATGCDFIGNNISSIKSNDTDCGRICLFTKFCTHFTWSNYANGTCWMKKGTIIKSQAITSLEKSTICGVIELEENIDFTPATFLPKMTNPLQSVQTTPSLFDTTTVAKKGIEKMKDYIFYQFLEKFFLYLSGPIFISLFAFFGFLINQCTDKINKKKEETKPVTEVTNIRNSNTVAPAASQPHTQHGYVNNCGNCGNCAMPKP